MPVLGLSFLLAHSRLLFQLVLPKHLHHTQLLKLPQGCAPNGGTNFFLEVRGIFSKLYLDQVIACLKLYDSLLPIG